MANLASHTIDQLKLHDEDSFAHVALYEALKQALVDAKYTFRVLPKGASTRHDHALLLNLTYWQPDAGGDVLPVAELEADVVAHVAWHHLANQAFPRKGATASADALFLAEAIASAFDVYLVGRLLGHAKDSSFLESQVPAMADAAAAADLPEEDFEALLGSLAEDPDAAFSDLRVLLWDTTRALFDATSADEGYAVLRAAEAHRFGALLHRYELSNWVLFARAYASKEPDDRVRTFEAKLRGPNAIDVLQAAWLPST